MLRRESSTSISSKFWVLGTSMHVSATYVMSAYGSNRVQAPLSPPVRRSSQNGTCPVDLRE